MTRLVADCSSTLPRTSRSTRALGKSRQRPQLPPYLAKWASNIPVGDESNIDEVFFGLNTVMREPMLEGFVDMLGPFNPAAIIGEAFNNARQPEMATWPNVNRVNTQGGVKAPPLRHVAETGPLLPQRRQVDPAPGAGLLHAGAATSPKTNSAHRDFLIMNLLDGGRGPGRRGSGHRSNRNSPPPRKRRSSSP